MAIALKQFDEEFCFISVKNRSKAMKIPLFKINTSLYLLEPPRHFYHPHKQTSCFHNSDARKILHRGAIYKDPFIKRRWLQETCRCTLCARDKVKHSLWAWLMSRDCRKFKSSNSESCMHMISKSRGNMIFQMHSCTMKCLQKIWFPFNCFIVWCWDLCSTQSFEVGYQEMHSIGSWGWDSFRE